MPLIRAKAMWPAIMLAASRRAKVRGRIKLLTDSIMTRNGIKTAGHPPGARDATCRELWVREDNKKASQRGKANVAVLIRWLVVLKEAGIKPTRFWVAMMIITLDDRTYSPLIEVPRLMRFSE